MNRYKFLTIGLLSLLLLLSSLSTWAQNTPSVNEGRSVTPLQQSIEAKIKYIIDKKRTVDQLSEQDFMDLPVGIARKVGETTYIVAVDSAYTDEGGWFFSAYSAITFPGATRPIAFAAKKIAFTRAGIAASTQTRLMLVSEQMVSLNEVDLVLPANEGNYLEFDCKGFKSVNLKGHFLFKAGLLQPDGEAAIHTTSSNDRVSSTFEINTSDLNNIITSVSIPPFKVNGLDDFSFQVKNAVVDMSDIANPAGFSFPQDYQQAFRDDIQLWRGFYLQDVAISFKGVNGVSAKDFSIQAQNLLIDNLGVSGLFSSHQILAINEGSADGWPLSIDRLSVKLLHNHLAGGGFAGALNIPFLGKDTLGYAADMEQVDGELNYKFAINTNLEKSFTFPLAGKIKLNKGCLISLEKREGKLVPAALLNGKLEVEASLFNVKEISFEKLGLVTQKPYVISGVFSLVGEKQGKTAGFPVRIDSITLQVFHGQVGLGAKLALNMMNQGDKGFSASTYVQVSAKVEETVVGSGELQQKKQQWKFDKVKVNEIILKCKTNAFGLDGRLNIFDSDPVYGNGFNGHVTVTIAKIVEKGVQANAYFGSIEDYRYWHIDVYVPTGNIPIVPPISINGIIGGMSYHMVRAKEFAPDFNSLNTSPGEASTANKTEVRNPRSEFAFIPDAKVGLAFMAGVTLIAGNEKAFNSDAVFEVAFNKGGGIKYVKFKGAGYFFTEVKSRSRNGETSSAPVYAGLNMLFDNDNDVFHAYLKTCLNLSGAIRGTGPGGLVGEAVIHVDRKDWYIYIGRPTQMLGVDIASLAVAQAYFMIGTKVENLPLPPSQVAEVFDDIDLNFMRDENAMATGRGFALGARFQTGFDTKDKVLPFYALLEIGAGADVMLRDYGSTTACKGRTGAIGMNGWYASGQAYVFLKGAVGIQVKKKKFDFLKLGAAALLQAKLPNPTWMRGAIGGKYAILGGLVKGKFNVKFTVGEECEIMNQGGELGDIQIIADIRPDHNGKEVNVLSAPQVSFNTAIGQELTMMNNEDQTNTYRIKLDECKLLKEKEVIFSTLEWNARKDVVVLRTAEILPQQAQVKVVAKLHWEKKLSNGAWEPLKENGQIDYEVKETVFTTGKAPDNIPEENVAYSYPVKYQYHFYKQEYGKGYVKLKLGQSYLFKEQDNLTTRQFVARFQTKTGKKVEVPLSYDGGNATINFTIPGELSSETIYGLAFVKIPAQVGSIDKNMKRTEAQVKTADEDHTIHVSSNMLEGTIVQKAEKDIYVSAFRTSKYNSFAEKLNTLSGQQDLFDIAVGNIAVIGKRANLQETFDQVELRGDDKATQPLVQVVASMENIWFKETIHPLLYERYQEDKDVTISLWRDPAKLGVAPLKAVKLSNDNFREGYSLSQTNVDAGFAAAQSGSIEIGYYLSYYSFKDYDELRNKAAQKFLTSAYQAPEGVRRLLAAKGYTDLQKGNFPVSITYVLPGINQTTNSKVIDIKF